METTTLYTRTLPDFLAELQHQWQVGNVVPHAEATSLLLGHMAARPHAAATTMLEEMVEFIQENGSNGLFGPLSSALSAAKELNPESFEEAAKLAESVSEHVDLASNHSYMYIDIGEGYDDFSSIGSNALRSENDYSSDQLMEDITAALAGWVRVAHGPKARPGRYADVPIESPWQDLLVPHGGPDRVVQQSYGTVDFCKTVYKHGAQKIGEAGGAVAGFFVGGPIGAAAGAILGGFIGAVFGDATQDIVCGAEQPSESVEQEQPSGSEAEQPVTTTTTSTDKEGNHTTTTTTTHSDGTTTTTTTTTKKDGTTETKTTTTVGVKGDKGQTMPSPDSGVEPPGPGASPSYVRWYYAMLLALAVAMTLEASRIRSSLAQPVEGGTFNPLGNYQLAYNYPGAKKELINPNPDQDNSDVKEGAIPEIDPGHRQAGGIPKPLES